MLCESSAWRSRHQKQRYIVAPAHGKQIYSSQHWCKGSGVSVACRGFLLVSFSCGTSDNFWMQMSIHHACVFLESKFVFAAWLNWVGITGQLFNGRIVYRFFPQNISLYTFHGQNAASNSGKIIAMKVLNKSNSNPRVRLGDFVAILTEGRTSTYLPRKQNGHCEPFHRRNRPIQRRDAGSTSPATRQRGSHCRIGVQNVVLLCFHSRWFRLCCFSNLGRFPIFSRYRERTVPFAGRERKKERERKRERHDSKKPTDQLPE